MRALNEAIVIFRPEHLKMYHLKVLSAARLMMQVQTPQIRQEALKLWTVLLQKLDISILKTNLNQIVVFLLNFLEGTVAFDTLIFPLLISYLNTENEKEIIDLLTYLFITKHEQLKEKIAQITFIPDKPSLKNIHVCNFDIPACELNLCTSF